MAHNQYPARAETNTFSHAEKVQFSDGEIALGFRTQGDRLILGLGSSHKYARDFVNINMAWINTKSGNRYALGGGYVINQNTKGAYLVPVTPLNVTIGEPLNIPNVGVTTDVESVLLRWKVDTPGSSAAELHVDAPSPFQLMDSQLESIYNAQQG